MHKNLFRLPLGLLIAAAAATAATPPAPRGAPPAPLAPASAPASTPAPSRPAPLVDACPAQLPVHQTISQDLAGWTALNEQSNYPFARIALYPGAPPDTTRIVPTSEYRTATGMHDTWTLPARPGGYWVACNYGNTTATVARKLPDNVDYCVADYDGRFVTLVVRHWACGERRVLATLPARTAPRPALQPQPHPPAPVRPPVHR